MSATIQYSEHPPPPLLQHTAVCALADARSCVGRVERDTWRQVISYRDPVNILKREFSHVNRATFKMHEIIALFMADCVPRNALHLAEAPGGFVFSTMLHWPTCQCLAMSKQRDDVQTDHAENNENKEIKDIAWSDRIQSESCVIRGLPHAGDLMESAVEEEIIARYEGDARVDLVTADGGNETTDLDFEEQLSTRLVFAQAATALRCCAKDGVVVLKIFEGSTLPIRQLFELFRVLFHRTVLHKPLCSRACNSERYIVALGLKDTALAHRASRQFRNVVHATRFAFVCDIGVHVTDVVHTAFDDMAQTQAAEIRRHVDVIRIGKEATQFLIESSRKEATRLRALFLPARRTDHTRTSHNRGREHVNSG